MKIYLHILTILISGFLISACTESESEGTEALIPIRFAASTGNVEVISEARSTNNGIISEDDLVGKDVTLFGREYLGTTPPTAWAFMGTNGWKATVVKSDNDYVLDYATNNAMKYYRLDDSSQPNPYEPYKYNFMAVHPYIESTGEQAGLTWNTTFPEVKVDLKYNPDLMVAKTDVEITKPNSDQYISLQFKHQLVCVTFNIIKDVTVEQGVYLNEMTKSGCLTADFDITTGTFSNYGNSEDGTVLKPELIPGSALPDFTVPDDNPKKIADVILFTANGNVTSERYKFKIKLNEVTYDTIELPAQGDTWETGKQYIYTIRVRSNENIYVEISRPIIMEDWVDENKDIEIN